MSINAQACSLSRELSALVESELKHWEVQRGTERLWSGDPSLWTGTDEAQWLGWTGIAETLLANPGPFASIREESRSFAYALLLGMGGSSLCPEVLAETFGRVPGHPELLVLDSTDPGQINAIESRIDLARTLFIVASKSGSTLEPSIFKAYFLDRARSVLGSAGASRHFVAITDPHSQLQAEAEADGFLHVFPGVKSIGGRYSALSNFGMVPAAIMGLDVERLLGEAVQMLHACGPKVPTRDNPGVVLGIVLGVLHNHGLDKVTLLASPGLRDLGAWLEQLLAESTGKQGRGLIPVDREDAGPLEVYGDDRVFVYLRLGSAHDAAADEHVDMLTRAGKPVVRIDVPTSYHLAQEFFRWELATAVAGSVMGVNPFDQPDVEASKVATRMLTSEYETRGSLPVETPFMEAGGLALFADATNVAATGGERSLAAVLRRHFDRLARSDYFGLLAYLPMNARNEEQLQAIRRRVRDAKHVATCLGFGPRFLHSTGQAYKGGRNTGVFLQITCHDRVDIPVPGRRFTFGAVKAAQARGDFQVLAERKRRALRVHIDGNLADGLRTLETAAVTALSR
jgi:transaldolase/glucose-6-phosphate isomerase